MTTADDVHAIEVVVRRAAGALVWGDDGRRVCDVCRLNWWLTSLCSSLMRERVLFMMPRRPGHVGRAATTAALARGKFGNRAQLSVRAAAPHARARVRSDEEVRRDSHAEFAEVIEVIVFCKNEAICASHVIKTIMMTR